MAMSGRARGNGDKRKPVFRRGFSRELGSSSIRLTCKRRHFRFQPERLLVVHEIWNPGRVDSGGGKFWSFFFLEKKNILRMKFGTTSVLNSAAFQPSKDGFSQGGIATFCDIRLNHVRLVLAGCRKSLAFLRRLRGIQRQIKKKGRRPKTAPPARPPAPGLTTTAKAGFYAGTCRFYLDFFCDRQSWVAQYRIVSIKRPAGLDRAREVKKVSFEELGQGDVGKRASCWSRDKRPL